MSSELESTRAAHGGKDTQARLLPHTISDPRHSFDHSHLLFKRLSSLSSYTEIVCQLHGASLFDGLMHKQGMLNLQH